MKRKLLLSLLLVVGGLVYAQNDTIKTLLITEAHLGEPSICYVEISNVGDEAIQLSDFEIGQDQHNDFINTDNMMLPEYLLQPGESFLLAKVRDYGPYAWSIGQEYWRWTPITTPLDLIELADIQFHVSEQQAGYEYFPEYDSVSEENIIGMYFGRRCVYLEQHFPSGDSAQVDQVMGIFDEAYGSEGYMMNKNMALTGDAYDVAGYPAAGNFAVLIRKHSVKEGNMEFVVGTGEDDSEWIALDNLSGSSFRDQPWTLRNHGDYNLDENTLTSTVADVDFPNKTITVPWGTLKPDGIMELMNKKPGVYWNYILNGIEEDSLDYGCNTGDRLEVIVCGDDADRDTFDIIVSDPLESDNFVVPRANWTTATTFSAGLNPELMPIYVEQTLSGHFASWPSIIDGGDNMDTLSSYGLDAFNLGIPYATRVDSLYERLEKPPLASWEIVPVDGNKFRPDLMEGDILKVTAEDGSTKEYYLQVQTYEGSLNFQLSSITWPDIPDPDLFELVYGWKGDTIPNFDPGGYLYQVKLPADIEQVPATVAKAVSDNSVVSVDKAVSLSSIVSEDRTTTYTVQAEGDTTGTYVLEWQREQLPNNIQPYHAEPIVSQYIGRYYFSEVYLEIANTGNQPMDLSHYMFMAAYSTNPYEAITTPSADWMNRYDRYVPGRKWVDSTTWATDPFILEEDLGVDPWVQPGDVFCMSGVQTGNWWGYGRTGWTDTTQKGITEADVQFYDTKVYDENGNYVSGYDNNPWGEPVALYSVPMPMCDGGEALYVFKILDTPGGDSVRDGLKPATDPNDFELIESMGMKDGSPVMFGQLERTQAFNFTAFIRKPEFVFPKPELEGSFGDTLTQPESSEWIIVGRFVPEYTVPGWPDSWIHSPMVDYGKHYFIPTTDYLSVVSSNYYRVSLGYSDDEDIEGLVTGVTPESFLPKLDTYEGQTLMVVSGTDGSEVAADAAIANGDTLLVTSADGVNTTKYVLDVSDEGLNSDALITSATYTVEVTVDPAEGNDWMGEGTLSGFPYGTTLETVLDNITLPSGATMTMLDNEGTWVPFSTLNLDTVYVKTTVNDHTMLQVVAEDMVTTIDYMLMPDATSDDAMVYSDIFLVDQATMMIDLVPSGISVNNFMRRVYASRGATMKIVDKAGLEREGTGIVRFDDKLVVTSESGAVSRAYYLMFSVIDYNPYILYVLSDVYDVDNVDYVIPEVLGETSVSDFLANLTPSAPDATMVVADKDGNVKPDDGVIVADDKLVVEFGDLKVVYTVTISTVGTPSVIADQISVYPNPTGGQLQISGLAAGQRIQVYNQVGTMIRDLQVNALTETVSLEDQPAGMYIIMVSGDDLFARYKVIKQ